MKIENKKNKGNKAGQEEGQEGNVENGETQEWNLSLLYICDIYLIDIIFKNYQM